MHNAGSSQQGQQTEEDEGSGTGEDIVAKTKELFQLLKDVNSLVSKYGSDDEINHVIDLTYSYVKEQNKLTAIMEEGKDTLDAELQYREQIQNIRDHPEQYHVDLKELISRFTGFVEGFRNEFGGIEKHKEKEEKEAYNKFSQIHEELLRIRDELLGRQPNAGTQTDSETHVMRQGRHNQDGRSEDRNVHPRTRGNREHHGSGSGNN